MESQDKTKEQLLEELQGLEARFHEMRRAPEESEEKFRLLYENAPLGCQSLDENGCFIEINQAWSNLLGYSREEVIGKWCGDFLTPAYREKFTIYFPQFKAAGAIHGIEFEMVKKDGSRITVAADGRIRYDEQGKFKQTHCILHDITEQKRVEEARARNEKIYRQMFEGSRAVKLLIDPESGELVDANPAAAHFYGYAVDDLKRMKISDINTLPPEQIFAEMAKAKIMHRQHFFFQHRLASGEIRDVEVHSSPLDLGATRLLYSIIHDITDRKRIETHLRDSEERFRTLFETAPDCIFMKDRSLRYTLVNPAMANLFGLPPSDFIGKTAEDLYGEWIGSHLRERDSRVLGGESVEVEHTRSIAGTPITFHDITIPIRNSAGEIVGVCGLSVNITDRNQRVTPFRAPVTLENRSETMRATMVMATVAAEKEGMILLEGESGVGKDYLARYIHAHSPRRDGPYFALNCAALPPELVESELFGYEPGAFTGASRRKRGLLELAEGGTLLLNEIGELSPNIQSKLLSFLDSRSFTRVGGEKIVKVDARLMAATNRDLMLEVKAGRFRQDLYYRINVLGLRVPPLRERREDIPILVHQIMARLKQEMQLPEAPVINSQSMNALTNYSWPGNVRELRNVLERALMLWTGGPLELSLIGREEVKDWYHMVRFPQNNSLNDVTHEVTCAVVAEALRRSGGNKVKAAGFLGISRYTLFRLLKSFDVNVRL